MSWALGLICTFVLDASRGRLIRTPRAIQHHRRPPYFSRPLVSCERPEGSRGPARQLIDRSRQSSARQSRPPGGGIPAAEMEVAQAVSGGQKTSARTSILSRGAALGGLFGSSNEVCAVKRARPSSLES